MKIRIELPWGGESVMDINEETGVCWFVIPTDPHLHSGSRFKLVRDIEEGYVQSLFIKPNGQLPDEIVKERRRASLAKAQELHKKESAEKIVQAAQMYFDYLNLEG